jgi:hypothetical protein
MPEHAAMLEPLAGLVVPVGHRTATPLAENVPTPAVYEFIVVFEVSVRTEASNPGQKVAGRSAPHSLMSIRSMCEPADMA